MKFHFVYEDHSDGGRVGVDPCRMTGRYYIKGRGRAEEFLVEIEHRLPDGKEFREFVPLGYVHCYYESSIK